jgi:hypothetical protein
MSRESDSPLSRKRKNNLSLLWTLQAGFATNAPTRAERNIMTTIIFSVSFLLEVRDLALKIAKKRRNEDHMQDGEILFEKFGAEMQELSEASEQWDELPDLAYYAACMKLVAKDASYTGTALQRLSQEITKRAVTVAQLEAGTLAKYRLRAIQEKNIEAERAAILEAIEHRGELDLEEWGRIQYEYLEKQGPLREAWINGDEEAGRQLKRLLAETQKKNEAIGMGTLRGTISFKPKEI